MGGKFIAETIFFVAGTIVPTIKKLFLVEKNVPKKSLMFAAN